MTQSERGEYRAIRQVLLDGPDFQKLSERARFAFLVIKIGSGPTGLQLEYDLALVEKVANRTGMSVRAAKKAVVELENAGWIERESNVVLIRGHLEHDPFMRSADKNHRTSIQRYVAGLPRLAIVRRFVAEHPAWFVPTELTDNGLGWTLGQSPMETPTKGPAATENRELNTENQGGRRKTEEGGRELVPPPTAPPPTDFADFGWLASRLANDADREALDKVLKAAPNPRAWCLEMAASLDVTPGHVPLTAIQLGEALRDYVSNGAHRQPAMRQFRRYLERTSAGERKPQ